MEATGLYWLALFSFLDEADYFIHVIKPIQTDGWRKGTEIRKRKTDIIIPKFIIYIVSQTSINQVFINKKIHQIKYRNSKKKDSHYYPSIYYIYCITNID